MLAAGDVVKLVAKESVMIDAGELDQQLAGSQREEHHARAQRHLALDRVIARN
jgi:hypothetical protein